MMIEKFRDVNDLLNELNNKRDILCKHLESFFVNVVDRLSSIDLSTESKIMIPHTITDMFCIILRIENGKIYFEFSQNYGCRILEIGDLDDYYLEYLARNLCLSLDNVFDKLTEIKFNQEFMNEFQKILCELDQG